MEDVQAGTDEITRLHDVRERRSLSGRELLLWAATLLAFPLAGLAGRAIAGPVDATWTAILAGAVAGLVLGVAQWLALRRIGIDARWILATGGGLAVGLGLAFALFGYGHTVSDMWIVGAVSGLVIVIAQWPLLHGLFNGSIAWIPATAAAWALGWTVTTAIGVDPDDRWAVFGLSGSATCTLFLGAVLWLLARSSRRDRVTA